MKKQFLNKKFLKITLITLAILQGILPVKSQTLVLPDVTDIDHWLIKNTNISKGSACIRLDGICLFKIVSAQSDIAERVNTIEDRVTQISNLYYAQENTKITIEQKIENNLPNIYVTIDNQKIRLMTVTSLDIQNEGIDLPNKANFIIEQLEAGLKRGRQERQLKFLILKGLIAGGIVGGTLIINFFIRRKINQLKFSRNRVTEAKFRDNQPMSTILNSRHQWNIKEVQYRLLQLAQWGTYFGASWLILGLFPYTRIAQIWLFIFFRIPTRLGIVGLGTYVVIRLSYALIDKSCSVIFSNGLLDLDTNQRLQLRITTISIVSRSIITIILIGFSIILGLSVIGINTAPLLAGLGILGVGISLASQNLIRDAINGFFIIIEDQYAVGDVIQVDKFGGMVENINLRITQIRDSEGRLITIPNSEVKIVANLSSHWSRADLNIPIAYETNVDQALQLIKDVAEEMCKNLAWRESILGNPEILGVDNFEERGLIIRVWIKTKPLKQWDVSREFRRRLKIAFDRQGLPLSLPQHKIWLTDKTSKSNNSAI